MLPGHRLLFTLLILFISVGACATPKENIPGPDIPYVVLVSFDGFRHDYLQRDELPNFHRLIREGSSADGIVSGFPSNTFPNHYTLVTGLYPGHHGLVDNHFYSNQCGGAYHMGDRAAVEDSCFYGGLPLWQHLQANGLSTASFFWVGSEAAVAGSRPDHYRHYDGGVANEARIAQVGKWLALPENERPRFITLYFSLVDSAGHASGPDSPATRRAVREADALVGLLLAEIEATDLPVNLIVTTDHGMYPVRPGPDTITNLSALPLGGDDSTVVSSSTLAHVYVEEPAAKGRIYSLLKAREGPGFQVYRKEESPRHWHYRRHSHIGDIVIVAQPGHILTESAPEAEAGHGDVIGVHGYDPRGVDELKGIFLVWGPAFEVGLRLRTFENVHVFPLITRLFGLPDPVGLDGRPEVLAPLLKAP